eukprot:RCo022636
MVQFVNLKIKPRVLRTKKKHPSFRRFQSDLFVRVRPSWRKPHGIDSRMRRRFKGMPAMPKIGYKGHRALRNVHPDGMRHLLINNVRELEMLVMCNRKWAAVVAHGVGAKKRKAIVDRAKKLHIRVVNRNARLRREEHE